MDDADSHTRYASGFTFHVSTLVALLHLALALLQVGLFGVLVGEGRGLDVGLLPEAVYRVDGLGVVLGVGWCLGMALVVWEIGDSPGDGRWVGACLMTVGLLNAFYARLPLIFYLGWEIAGLGLWLAVRFVGRENRPVSKDAGYTNKARLRGLPGPSGIWWVLHVAGWPLLLVILLGLVMPFAPPVGGVARAWPWPVTLGLAVVVLIRSGCPPFDGWVRLASGVYRPLLGLYAIAAPALLAKMLVAAPWDVVGGWALVLVGTAALLGSMIMLALRGEEQRVIIATTALSATAITGLGLATGLPLAPAGAIALMLAGMVSAVAIDRVSDFMQRPLCDLVLLIGATPGIWLVSQGALALGYGVVAAVVLPAIAFAGVEAYRRYAPTEMISEDDASHEGGSRTAPTDAPSTPITRYPSPVKVALGLVVLAAVYPQALVEFGLRPAVGAMAGGVGTLSMLKSDWGVGLSLETAQGAVLAALPATGIAVAIFLAWVALYWLKAIFSRFVRERAPGAEPE